jgi:hypothetical protein
MATKFVNKARKHEIVVGGYECQLKLVNIINGNILHEIKTENS